MNYINGDFDLLLKDANGTTASVKQAGGQIFARKSSNGLIPLTVFYKEVGITEDYVFQLDGKGDGTVGSTVVRAAAQINKMSLMTAQCRGPR